jgi:DNA segregation ATPase FtsK/SpoIIIE, S-DNA-T family
MKLHLTAVAVTGPSPGFGEPVDLALEVEPGTTVRRLAEVLTEEVVPAGSTTAGPTRLRLVPAGGRLPTETQPLFLGSRPLPMDQPLLGSPIRQGAVIGVGGALPDVMDEPGGLVEVRVASGPGAGRVHRLSAGSAAIGTAPHCPIRLADDALPEVAAWLEVAVDGSVRVHPEPGLADRHRPAPLRSTPLAGPIVVPREPAPRRVRLAWWPRRLRRWRPDADLGQPHDDIDPHADVPVAHLEREALDTPRPWRPGEALVLGACLLELARPQPPDASLSPSAGSLTSDYNRPPRLLPARRRTSFSLPPEPSRPDRQSIPWMLVIAPLLMSLTLFWFTKSPYSLIFAIFSPMMALSNVTSSRRQATLRYREQITEYHRRSRDIRTEAYAALLAERTARRRDLPDPAAVLLVATGPRSSLWERRPEDPDWLHLRVGTADQASEVTLRDPAREEHQGPLTWTTPDVPVMIDLARSGVVGVAGPAPVRAGVARWALAQAATLHSPTALELVILGEAGSDDQWSWVRWLPHARTPEDGLGGALSRVGSDPRAHADRINELLDLLEARRRRRAEQRGTPSEPDRDVLVVLDGARRLRLIPGLISLLQDGPAVGIRFLCLDEDVRQLPEECRAVVVPGDDDLLTARVTRDTPVEGIRADLVSIAWCERLARALAPIRDVSDEDLSGNLPPASRLVDVLLSSGVGTDPDRIGAGWATRPRSTVAVIGEGGDGPFAVDIRRDGPHALVAGTTGSGKSELLQTLIASLAVVNRPDEMTFVLIDYKGGAAFKDCRDLPHTVGMVTDLDGHLTRRALDSLAAELRRREHLLNSAGAKDIDDYTAARSRAGAGARIAEPMPRLMLVIDEFAALVAELPDFVNGLVDIARRGRSLGVHLVLATQRPAGVVSAEIKSNTSLRIALRVTDPQDSQDVIESSDAAAISKSLPGRAYARLGHASLIPFQSARIGGRDPGSSSSAVRIRPMAWSALGAPFDLDAGPAAEDDVTQATDLENLVRALREAAASTGVRTPPSPWLPALPSIVALDGAESTEGETPVPFGILDLPDQQSQSSAELDLGHGHLAAIGAPRSGRSTVLRTVAASIATRHSAGNVHLYGVDCGGNALLPVVSLPHTGAVVTRDQPDRLARLTARLTAELSRRQQLLAEQGFASVLEQRAGAAPGERLPHIVVLFDRWEAFTSTFETFDSGRLIDAWLALLQEGAGAGLTVVLSCDRSGLAGRIGAIVDDKLVLRMTDPGDFAAVGLPLAQVPSDMPPGRGFRTADGVREVQVAMLGDDPSGPAQVAELQAIGRRSHEQLQIPAERLPFRVDLLPARITLHQALTLGRPPRGQLGIGVGGDTLALRTVDLVDHGPGIIVAGPRRSGRSTTLAVLAVQAHEAGWRLGVVTPRTSPLRRLSESLGLRWWDQDGDRAEVTAALQALAPANGDTPSLLLIDDLEVLGTDGWLPDLLTDHLAGLRDSGCGVIAAGTLDELGGAYRGPVAALKKSRSGLLLSPSAANDGDLFGVRLSRSVLGGPPGRGVLVIGGGAEAVQVPTVPGPVPVSEGATSS